MDNREERSALFAVFRFVVAVVCAGLAVAASAGAQELSESDGAAGVAAINAARGGDWAQAYAQASRSTNPLPLKVIHWLDYSRTSPSGRFLDIAQFISANPDWPAQKLLRRRAEEAMSTESDATVADWLKRYPPISAIGKAREAEITLSQGRTDAGLAALRQVWIDGDFTATDERNFWSRFADKIRPEDNIKRLDRLLWDGQNDAVRRMLPMAPTDYRALAEARLTVAEGAANSAAMVARVPAPLQADLGLAFAAARAQRKAEANDAAAQILLAHPDNPVRPALWLAERQTVARRLLGAGNAELAYRVVTQHAAAGDTAADSESEFLSGYIALRYLKNPSLAFGHFSRVLARIGSPGGKARAAYWSGRAADAEGKRDLAVKWYAAGAEHMVTFYGQLAAHQLGHDAPPRPLPEPRPSTVELARFSQLELVQATSLFSAAGDREHVKVFLLQLADTATKPIDFALIAAFAEQHGRIDIAIIVARRSIEAGMPLMIHGYPVTILPSGGVVEHPLLLAIVRTESAFDQEAVSPAGARGLMQLMPGTAALVARQQQVPYSLDRLTSDGVYNIQLGRAYIEQMMGDFGGSYALAIAAYNAGPGRVRQWLHDYGDPRGRDVDMVDWIETIPISETRLYTQRVLESLQMYRGQDGMNTSAFTLAGDLAR
jgi:soluble lytic murein transglycosylase